MRRLALLAALSGLAASSPAVTLTLDSPFTVMLPQTGAANVNVTGTLAMDAGTVGSPSKASTIGSVALLFTTGSGPGTSLKNPTANSDLLTGVKTGSFTGLLFTLPITATTPAGTYTDTGQYKIVNGSTSYLSNPVAFTVILTPYVAPVATPEPSVLAVLGVVAVGLVRRRRR